MWAPFSVVCPQIYNVGAYPPSASCDHLNFVKHAFMHGTYRITGEMDVWCEYQVGGLGLKINRNIKNILPA